MRIDESLKQRGSIQAESRQIKTLRRFFAFSIKYFPPPGTPLVLSLTSTTHVGKHIVKLSQNPLPTPFLLIPLLQPGNERVMVFPRQANLFFKAQQRNFWAAGPRFRRAEIWWQGPGFRFWGQSRRKQAPFLFRCAVASLFIRGCVRPSVRPKLFSNAY